MDEKTLTSDEKRIKDADSARTMYTKYRADSDQRRIGLARIMNQLNGGRPFDDADLIKNGQGWRCNINFRDASSTLEQVLVSYWRLLHDSTNLAAVTIHTASPNSDAWRAIFEDNFNRFTEDWGDVYVRNYLLFSANHLTTGIGSVFWNDAKSPRWESIRVGNLDTDSEALADVQSLEVVAIRQPYTISRLWDRLRTPAKQKASEALGWNTEELRKLLWHQLHGSQNPLNNDYLEVEDRIRNNSYGISSTAGPITLVHLFVKEFDGKISTYIFSASQTESGYLFDNSGKANRPDDMRQMLGCVFFEAGNGQFWGVKGFGQKNYQISTILNRLKSRAVDRTLLDGLNFIDKSEGGLSQMPVTNIGPFNLLPPGLEQIPSYPTGTVILQTIGMVESGQNNNNARYRDQSTQIANTDTARQATILATLQSQVDVANATLYLTQIARNLFSEQFRRLRLRGNTDIDAVNFRKRCVDEGGMDPDFFYDAEISLRTGADPGAASVALQGEKAKELLQFSGDANVNSRWAWEKYISANFGSSAVKRALNPVDALGDIAAQRLALMENSDFGEGNQLPVAPTDNHVAHIPAHLKPLSVIVHTNQQSGKIDPNAVLALHNVIPHLEEHFNFLKQDVTKKQYYQQLFNEYSQLKNGAVSILKQVERMHNDAQQPGFVPPQSARGGGGMINPQAAIGAAAPQ